jgi:hypothetical protein
MEMSLLREEILVQNLLLDIYKNSNYECIVCFEKFYNIKILSCGEHKCCHECWSQHSQTRINMTEESNQCFVCEPRNNFISTEEHNPAPELPYILIRLYPFNILGRIRNIIDYKIIFQYNIVINIVQADIRYMGLDNDIIVNIANNKYLRHNHGLARRLYEHASHTLGTESLNWVKQNGVLDENKVAITNGGLLFSKVLHSYGPNPIGKSEELYERLLEHTYDSVFRQICHLTQIPTKICIPPILARNVDINVSYQIMTPIKVLFKTINKFLRYLQMKGVKEINITDWGEKPEILHTTTSIFQQQIFN